jgi:hypothetical protein
MLDDLGLWIVDKGKGWELGTRLPTVRYTNDLYNSLIRILLLSIVLKCPAQSSRSSMAVMIFSVSTILDGD